MHALFPPLVCFTHDFSNFLPGLQHNFKWDRDGSHEKQVWQALVQEQKATSHRSLRNAESSSFQCCGSQANGLSNIMWLVKNSPSLTIISFSMLLHFEHAHFILAQTLKRSHEDWWSNELSIVWALHESFSKPSIQLLPLVGKVGLHDTPI